MTLRTLALASALGMLASGLTVYFMPLPGVEPPLQASTAPTTSGNASDAAPERDARLADNNEQSAEHHTRLEAGPGDANVADGDDARELHQAADDLSAPRPPVEEVPAGRSAQPLPAEDASGPPAAATPRATAPATPPPITALPVDRRSAGGGQGPTLATPPALTALPAQIAASLLSACKPAMPEDAFAWLLYTTPALRQLPPEQLALLKNASPTCACASDIVGQVACETWCRSQGFVALPFGCRQGFCYCTR